MYCKAILFTSLLSLGGCASIDATYCEHLAPSSKGWVRSLVPENAPDLLALTKPTSANARYVWYTNTEKQLRVCQTDAWSDVSYDFTQIDGVWRAEVVGITWGE